MLKQFKDKRPVIGKGTFVAENAVVIGDVICGEDCSIWFGAVVRGDSNTMRFGNRTNVQDLCVVHTDSRHELVVGDDCTVGHRALLHGCRIGSRCLIGMGAVIMNGAQIGDDCIVGAGALVTENTVIPPKTLVIGFPAKPKRELTAEELGLIGRSARHYAELAATMGTFLA
jgi:carbonic anhydrase/acetyltransferase-like protein (isoleucine patch superfamily)